MYHQLLLSQSLFLDLLDDICIMLDKFSDNELISLVCRGDERAFDLLFKRHHKTMYQYSVRLLKDADIAADIVQSVFVKLWEHKEYLSSDINIKAYLYSMVRNRVVNYIRDNRARLIHNYKIVQETGLVEEVEVLEQFEDILRHKELSKAMDTLPPQQRKVLQFRFEGKTNRQIAQEQNLSLNTVNTHYRLGVMALKSILKIITVLLFIPW